MQDDHVLVEVTRQLKSNQRTNTMVLIAIIALIVIQFVNPRGVGITNEGGQAHGQGGHSEVSNNIVVPDAKDQIKKRAAERGYFTSSEYAQYTDSSLETVYRHAQAGKIPGAWKEEGQWRIPLPQSGQ